MQDIEKDDVLEMVPKDVSEVPVWILASVGGAVYVALIQAVLVLSDFTTEVLWLWPLALADAWERGSMTSMLGSAEWWLAFAYPVAIASLGFVATYSFFRSKGVLASGVAALYLVAFALSEVVIELEIALAFVLLAPVTALAALGVHVAEARYLNEDLVELLSEKVRSQER